MLYVKWKKFICFLCLLILFSSCNKGSDFLNELLPPIEPPNMDFQPQVVPDERDIEKPTIINEDEGGAKEEDVDQGEGEGGDETSFEEMTPEELAEQEINLITEIKDGWLPILFGKTAGSLIISKERSITIDDLRGKVLDSELDAFVPRGPEYYSSNLFKEAAERSETLQDGSPYVSQGIHPFRFKYFNVIWNGGGYWSNALTDYSASRGVNIIWPYIRNTSDRSYLPSKSEWMQMITQVNFFGTEPSAGQKDYFYENNIPSMRYDLFYDHVQKLGEDYVIKQLSDDMSALKAFDPNVNYFMLDMEHAYYRGDDHPSLALNKQVRFYPSGGEEIKAAFEEKYWKGLELTYSLSVAAARELGWTNISFYGWEPFMVRYYGLDTAKPLDEWQWRLFGNEVYKAVDFVQPSVYCFNWNANCVAFTLANIDFNMEIVNSQSEKKPVNPYYWFRTHPSSGPWALQPRPVEDARAMIAMGFWTGFDGPAIFAWSGGNNIQVPPKLEVGKNYQINDKFMLNPSEPGQPNAPIYPLPRLDDVGVFNRYDTIQVIKLDYSQRTPEVTFQRLLKHPLAWYYNWGIDAKYPTYKMALNDLRSHIRPESDAIRGIIEGLALAKPFEYILRHGKVKIDVPANKQFSNTLPLESNLPIVRRVKLGKYHVIATYDPNRVFYSDIPRFIEIKDFDGVQGLALTLPADEQVRVFVLEESD